MRIVTVKSSLLREYTADPEMLQKATRPCVLILRLKYKEKKYPFAIPIRSNISGSAPKDTYFPLPPRSTTEDGKRHGIHYIKMFPISPDKTFRFRTKGNEDATRMKNIIDRNEKKIVQECQAYLDRYASGDRPAYSTDIEKLLDIYNATK